VDRGLAGSKLSEHRLRYCASVEPLEIFSTKMDPPMAWTAKGDEVFFHIPSQLAARAHMMNLQIFGIAAALASPTVALEYLLAKPPIRVPV